MISLNKYKNKNKLSAEFIGRGGAWMDAGSIEDFYNTSAFVSAMENRQGLKIACLEEIAFKQGWIDKEELTKQAQKIGNTPYGQYLLDLTNNS